MNDRGGSPCYLHPRTVGAGLVIAILVSLQALALEHQFEAGFWPFVHAPSRVPFSWDMFAVHVTKCAVSWEPPLSPRIGTRPVKSIADISPHLEWNPAFPDVASYRHFASQMCRLARLPPRAQETVSLKCLSDDWRQSEQTFECP